jgi:hypothetical protein
MADMVLFSNMQRAIIWAIIFGFILIAGWSTFPKLIPHPVPETAPTKPETLKVSTP